MALGIQGNGADMEMLTFSFVHVTMTAVLALFCYSWGNTMYLDFYQALYKVDAFASRHVKINAAHGCCYNLATWMET
jgi:hypothetical protein